MNSNLTDQEALIGGEKMLQKMIESFKKANEMIESLDSCQTQEEIDAWRETNKF